MDFLYTNFSFLFFFPPTSSSRKYGPFTSGLVSCCRCRCRCCCLVVERESTTTLSADRHFHFHFSHNQQQEIFFNNTGARCEWSKNLKKFKKQKRSHPSVPVAEKTFIFSWQCKSGETTCKGSLSLAFTHEEIVYLSLLCFVYLS